MSRSSEHILYGVLMLAAALAVMSAKVVSCRRNASVKWEDNTNLYFNIHMNFTNNHHYHSNTAGRGYPAVGNKGL